MCLNLKLKIYNALVLFWQQNSKTVELSNLKFCLYNLIFQLTRNIEKLFCKFGGQGKLTIRLLDPHKDVKIRGSADRLEEFMKLVKEVSDGNKTNIRPIPPNCVMEVPKKMAATISSITELSKLPKMLVSLTVSNQCFLYRIYIIKIIYIA